MYFEVGVMSEGLDLKRGHVVHLEVGYTLVVCVCIPCIPPYVIGRLVDKQMAACCSGRTCGDSS